MSVATPPHTHRMAALSPSSSVEENPSRRRRGVVSRLDPGGRFGYVQCDEGTFIFVVGRALSNRDAARLSVGCSVVFSVDGQDRVQGLSLEGCG